MTPQEEIAVLRDHVDKRLAEQDEKLDEVLDILRASKFMATAIKWTAAVAASIFAIWFSVREHIK